MSRRRRKNSTGALSVMVIVIAFLMVMTIQIGRLKEKDATYAAQEKELQQELTVLEADLQEAQRQCDQVEFQLTAARDQLRAAEDQVLTLQGEEKQYEILLSAVVEAQESARREKDALLQAHHTDSFRHHQRSDGRR